MEKQEEPVVPSKGFKYEKNKRDRQRCDLHKPQEVFVLSQLEIPSGAQNVVMGVTEVPLWMLVD